MSVACSAIVRSDENQPIRAIFRAAARPRRAAVSTILDLLLRRTRRSEIGRSYGWDRVWRIGSALRQTGRAS